MQPVHFAMAEMLLVFGLVVGFGLWELHKLRRLRIEREEREGRAASPDD